MKTIDKVITTYLMYKDRTKEEIINALRGINPDDPYSRLEHETLVYILLIKDSSEN